MKDSRQSLDRALEEAVSRALRDNLAPLQRTADEVHQAYADLISACSSARPSNALPAMLRAQAAASALAAGLSVLSNFVAVALHSPVHDEISSLESSSEAPAVMELEEPTVQAAVDVSEIEPEIATEPEWAAPSNEIHLVQTEPAAQWTEIDEPQVVESETVSETETETIIEVAAPEVPLFDLASLPEAMQDLHRRANRAAKVTMQDIQLLRPKDVRLGREHKDICHRLRIDLDRARKEYDRRFHAILDHPVDYFHRWMVEILAAGDGQALGEYPYPSPVLRH